MKFLRLTFTQVQEIYSLSLIKDFVKQEQKPLMVINILMRLGVYECFGLYSEEEELIAYAFLCTESKNPHVLLDYLCILEPYRGQGYGTICLNYLREEYKDKECLIVEVESYDSSDSISAKETKGQRIHFYEKNGFKSTQLLVNMFGVKLQIMALALRGQISNSKIREHLDQIYDRTYYDLGIRRNINFVL